MLTVKHLSFAFSQKNVLNGLNLEVPSKEICCIIGASGSGKTTLFQLIAGIYKPLAGEISLTGDLSYVTQQDLLLPWRDVLGNMLLPYELKKASACKEQALALLESLGLKGCENHYPHELSQGMRQRVSLATMIFQKTPLLLLDEPFASLDVVLREQLYSLLRNVRDQYDTTILMNTHDFRDALSLADRVVLLKEGSIQKEWVITEDIRKNPLEHYHVLRNNLLS